MNVVNVWKMWTKCKSKPPTQATNHKRIFYLLKNVFVFGLFFSPQLIFSYRAVIFGHLGEKKHLQLKSLLAFVCACALDGFAFVCIWVLNWHSIGTANGSGDGDWFGHPITFWSYSLKTFLMCRIQPFTISSNCSLVHFSIDSIIGWTVIFSLSSSSVIFSWPGALYAVNKLNSITVSDRFLIKRKCVKLTETHSEKEIARKWKRVTQLEFSLNIWWCDRC